MNDLHFLTPAFTANPPANRSSRSFREYKAFHIFLSCFVLLVTLFSGIPSQAQDAQYDLYGGWKGLQAEPKLYFHVSQIDGKWWFVSPGGNVFISKGVNHVSFTADFSPALNYSPYARVTMKKYQTESRWATATAERLKSWNFNTVGAWSSSALYDEGLAFTINLNIAAEAGGNWQYGRFPDVFSRHFEQMARSVAIRKCKPYAENLSLLGYFTDNELRWGPDWRSDNALLIDFLKMEKDSAGYQKAASFLQEKYPTIEELNQAWSTRVNSMEELAGLESYPESSSRTSDENAFLYQAARRYFQVCHEAIHEQDPNHLILGVRFAGQAPQPVLEAVKDFVDVVSFNTYNELPPEKTLRRIHQITQKPLMITEFSFKAMDSGLPNTKGAGKPVQTQQERADKFTRFVTNLMQLPFVIGYHWFEYTDEPKEGRFDGENSNYGLVNINDEPWQLLVDAMTRTNQKIEDIHLSSTLTSQDDKLHQE